MNLTPLEVIRIGIEQGHSADVILASLVAAGYKIVPEYRELWSTSQQWTAYSSPSEPRVERT